jgi:hypothetical protein
VLRLLANGKPRVEPGAWGGRSAALHLFNEEGQECAILAEASKCGGELYLLNPEAPGKGVNHSNAYGLTLKAGDEDAAGGVAEWRRNVDGAPVHRVAVTQRGMITVESGARLLNP